MATGGMWQVLINFLFAAILHSLAVVRIVLILRNIVVRRIKSSPFLITLFVNWLVLCILILPYELYGVFSWRIDDGRHFCFKLKYV